MGMGKYGRGGMGMGRGRGRGRGRALKGGGRGASRRAAFLQGAVPGLPATPGFLSASNELAMLRQQAEEMVRLKQQIHERIRQLERRGKTKTTAAIGDPEKCMGCGLCVEICPVGAISLENGSAVVDEGACTACGLCVAQCPNGAISMAWPQLQQNTRNEGML